MPGLRTEITEVVTGLATLPYATLADALAGDDPPPELTNVPSTVWQKLQQRMSEPEYSLDYLRAWDNGKAFLGSADGLRGRTPLRVEWKGPHQQPGYEFLPADLRIDHVFLVSCKYLSKVLANSSPENLFVHCLAQRGLAEVDWFTTVAPGEYETFYGQVRAHLSDVPLPTSLSQLTPAQRDIIGERCKGAWHPDLRLSAQTFFFEISTASAQRWETSLISMASKELMLWRMLRLASAPYFVLGASPQGSLRLRVATPWDWRQQFRLVSFDVTPRMSTQSVVDWHAVVFDKSSDDQVPVDGHIEVRWSHGRFCGHPEAKVYLDTPHTEVPGYFNIT